MTENINKISFIFHIGLYSFFGYDDIKSARKRKIQNGSEFYLERLQERLYKPISGSENTQKHHIKYGINYNYFNAPFSVNRQKITEWMDICVKCKATYVIITSRHNDGFCLWNTKITNKKTQEDIVLIFKEEAEKRGLIFGIYYSLVEFLETMTIDYFSNVCIPQINELLKYSPKIILFNSKLIKIKILNEYIRNMTIYLNNNGILINDEIKIHTIGLSFGYNKEQEEVDYKSGKQLFNLMNESFINDKNFLLNIGPKYDGSIDNHELKSLNELSLLL